MLDVAGDRFATVDQDRRDGTFAVGDEVWTAFDPEALHVFDAKSESRVAV
ncbi:MAG: TOBE domain-containing protein [Trueperaceae bacterium]